MDTKPIERPNTLAGLIEKRREIAGKIEHHQRILNELIVDLDHMTTPSGYSTLIAT